MQTLREISKIFCFRALVTYKYHIVVCFNQVVGKAYHYYIYYIYGETIYSNI